jgi:hypothetical protein
MARRYALKCDLGYVSSNHMGFLMQKSTNFILKFHLIPLRPLFAAKPPGSTMYQNRALVDPICSMKKKEIIYMALLLIILMFR